MFNCFSSQLVPTCCAHWSTCIKYNTYIIEQSKLSYWTNLPWQIYLSLFWILWKDTVSNLDFVLIFIGGPLFHPHSCISCWISEETRYVLIFMNMKKSIIIDFKSSKVFVFCDSYLTSSLLFSSVVKVCSLRCTLRNDSNMNVTHGRQIKIT